VCDCVNVFTFLTNVTFLPISTKVILIFICVFKTEMNTTISAFWAIYFKVDKIAKRNLIGLKTIKASKLKKERKWKI
jgi:hypothetical protein